MKAILYVELVGYDKPIEIADGSEQYVEIVKEFDISATPFIGMSLWFPSIAAIDLNDQKTASAKLAATQEPVRAVFKITEVNYFVGEDSYVLGTDYGQETYRLIEELDRLVSDLVTCYGFRIND